MPDIELKTSVFLEIKTMLELFLANTINQTKINDIGRKHSISLETIIMSGKY